METCEADFADVGSNGHTIGDTISTLKLSIKLGVGKIAPDIEGEDFDGVSFKLSDYQGKVVVLDFWGDW